MKTSARRKKTFLDRFRPQVVFVGLWLKQCEIAFCLSTVPKCSEDQDVGIQRNQSTGI